MAAWRSSSGGFSTTRAATNTGSATMQRSACQRTSAIGAAMSKASTSTPPRVSAMRVTTWPVLQALAQRRRQPAREPAIALGPGQHRVALVAVLGARRDGSRAGWRSSGCRPRPRPGRCRRRSRRGSSSPGTSAGAGRASLRGRARRRRAGRPAPAGAGVGAPCSVGIENRARARNRFHALREPAVLRERARRPRLARGSRPSCHCAPEEQALLRAVAQVALVVFPAAGHAAAQAQFLEQVLHLARVVAGHRQVVRAERAGDALDACRRGCCRRPRLPVRAVRSPRCRASRSARAAARPATPPPAITTRVRRAAVGARLRRRRAVAQRHGRAPRRCR